MSKNEKQKLTVAKISYVHNPDVGNIWWDFWLDKLIEKVSDKSLEN